MKRILLCLVLLGALSLVSVSALAAPLGYSLDWWTIDGGGGASQGGSYALNSTIGQPDAGILQGGSFSLQGGFWPVSSTEDMPHLIWLPLVVQ